MNHTGTLQLAHNLPRTFSVVQTHMTIGGKSVSVTSRMSWLFAALAHRRMGKAVPTTAASEMRRRWCLT